MGTATKVPTTPIKMEMSRGDMAGKGGDGEKERRGEGPMTKAQ